MYKALVVDDERMIRNGIRAVVPWENMGIQEVFLASSGQEAYKILEAEKPDIMITDIRMTEMTGLELIAKIREYNEKLKVIVLTGYDSFDYARQCIRMRVEEFLLKPVDEEVLIQTIQKIVTGLNEEKIEKNEEKRKRRILGTNEQVELEQLMNDIIKGKQDLDSILAKLRNNMSDLDATMRIAILVPPMQAQGEMDANNSSVTLMNIKNLLISVLDANEQGVTFENEEGQIVLALFEGEKSDSLKGVINEFTELIKGEYDISMKVILGGKVNGFKELKISYKEAELLLGEEKNFYETILEKTEKKNRFEMFQEIFEELKSIMGGNVGNNEKVMRAFESFCIATESYNISDHYVRKCCFEIASTVYFSYMVDSGENTNNKINALLSTLVNVKAREACEFTKAFLENLLEPEVDLENGIIIETKRYISQNLAEDISVSSIAEKFYVTPNYFSRLFKRITGEGCNEYIVKMRMEQAKFLLETTNLKTGVIAQMVGYRDTNYFSLAFKKYTSNSPTQFRKDIREKDSYL